MVEDVSQEGTRREIGVLLLGSFPVFSHLTLLLHSGGGPCSHLHHVARWLRCCNLWNHRLGRRYFPCRVSSSPILVAPAVLRCCLSRADLRLLSLFLSNDQFQSGHTITAFSLTLVPFAKKSVKAYKEANFPSILIVLGVDISFLRLNGFRSWQRGVRCRLNRPWYWTSLLRAKLKGAAPWEGKESFDAC
jgi:hypothetical protein